MLKQIQLKQFIIIEQLTIDFKQGMTVITGETGAGKSIVVDALLLAMGNRSASSVVRTGSERAEIIVELDLQNNLPAKEWLKSQDLFCDDECIIRRIITVEGRSRCYINDSAVTLQSLQQFSSLLINIHSQHEHQQLLKRESQRMLLDEYAGLSELAQQVKQCYQERQVIKARIDELNQLHQDQQNQKEYIEFQLQEFAKLKLGDNEVDQLMNEHKQLANAETLLANGQKALSLLCENDDAILDLLAEALRLIIAINQVTNQLGNSEKLLETSLIHVEEASNEIRDYLDKLHLNPERSKEIEQRLAIIHDLARKHRVAPQLLLQVEQQLKSKIMTLTNLEQKLKDLQLQLTTTEKKYYEHAKQLTAQRKQAAMQLSHLVSEKMQNLGLENGVFEVVVETNTTQHRISGFDQIEFLVTANQGQPLDSLHKIVSGGELSRISLAIQVIISEKITTPVMIFDEVDVGIGGKTADKVGRLLRELSQHAQVICITHLPQVAAQGHHHLLVSKSVIDEHTQAQIKELSEIEKIEELSRMLGGIHITEQTRAHAREMLELGTQAI